MQAIRPFISELMPLNRDRRDRVMHYFARQQTLTQYDICKLHVMVDVTHTLRNGRPYIGGPLEAWTFGPVVPATFFAARDWALGVAVAAFAASWGIAAEPQPVKAIGQVGKAYQFIACGEYASGENDFASTAVDAMRFAGDAVLIALRDFGDSQDYFHGNTVPPSPIGAAWKIARDEGETQLNWFDIFDAAGRHGFAGANVELARAHAELWLSE